MRLLGGHKANRPRFLVSYMPLASESRHKKSLLGPLTALLDITLRELKHQSYRKRLRQRAPCTGRARRHKATRELRAKQPLNAAAAKP